MRFTVQEKQTEAIPSLRANPKKCIQLRMVRLFVHFLILVAIIFLITFMVINLPIRYETTRSIQSDCGVSMHDPYYCFSQDPIKPQMAMSPKSPYELVRGQINPNVSTCKPARFWYIARNAAMLPSLIDLADISENSERLHEGIISNYDKGRTSLCASDMELIRNWKFDTSITPDRASGLAPSGWQEAKAPAERYQAAFPSLLPATYSASHYYFRPANLNRSVEHIRAFADGLFGVDGNKQVKFEDAPNPDLYLNPINSCPLWRGAVTELTAEYDQFLEGPEYQKMSEEVSAKLGFHGTHTLRISDIQLFEKLCQFDNYYEYVNSSSPFCAAFSIANYQVLQYARDLYDYYRQGYAPSVYHKLFENLGCFLLQDLVTFIQSNDDSDQKVRIFTGSYEIYHYVLVGLGVYRDLSLTHYNFAQQTNRSFKASDISPNGSNLVVIKFDCSDRDNDILFLINERPLPIPGCDENGLCKQSLIMEILDRYLNADCNDVFCRNE